jgi:hypothetical protein
MADNSSVEKLGFEQEVGSSSLVPPHTSFKQISGAVDNHDRFTTSAINDQTTESIAYPLSSPRKYTLLALFASALAIDGKQVCAAVHRANEPVICGSGVFLFTGAISEALDVLPAQQSWVIVSLSSRFITDHRRHM